MSTFMDTRLKKYEDFKKLRTDIYNKYDLKIEKSFDKLMGLDPTILESLVDNYLINKKIVSKDFDLDNCSLKEKLELFMEEGYIARIVELF